MYSIHEIASILNKTAVIRTDSRISQLLTDSRKLILPDEALFFAIATQRNNGMNYIAELYQKGVRNFVISNPDFDTSPYSGANFLLVENTLKALQNLAAKHRRKFDIPVIGITGSNGKTVVKEWISQILENVRKVVKSPKSFNSQIGVPLSVWQLREDTEIGIFEAGISEVSEMSNLQTIIQPTIGIFTNIGQAHDENFIHREQKTGEKLNLFTHVDTLIYCLDHKEIHNKIMASGIGRNIKTFTWSVEKPEVDVFIKRIDKQKNTSGIDFIFKNQNYHIDIPFVDAASIENAVHCLCTLLHLGFDMDFIQEGVMQLHPIEMRLEQKEGINGCTIINDSYSSDLNSLTIALDFLNQQNQHAKKTVILSDIFQSGMLDSELYQKIAQLLKEKNIHRIIGIGEKISSFASVFQKEQEFYANTHDFIIHFQSHNFANECILLKGARVFECEKIDQLLQQKTHESIMEINLD